MAEKKEESDKGILVNGCQPLFSINASLGFGTILKRVDSKYHGRDVEIPKDGVDYTYLLRFRPHDVYIYIKVENQTTNLEEKHNRASDLVDTLVQD